MNERLVRWNERYSRREETYDFTPSAPLPALLDLLPPGRALDVACGAGRHALYLASKGWEVVAVDGAEAGIAILRAEAARRGLVIESHVADLMSRPRGFDFPVAAFDLVCDFYFLDRTIFGDLVAALRPGGRLVAAIHTSSEPGDRLVAPGELGGIVRDLGLTIEREEEGESERGHDHGTSIVVARADAR